MQLIAKTDKGKVRESNQDSYVTRELDECCLYAVVCDGMGGASGGDIASELATRALDSSLIASYDEAIRNRSISTLLRQAIRHANGTIFSVSLKDASLKGMGTTVVAAYILDDTLYIAHVGDSRAYFYSDGKLTQITKDHSVVREMIDKGEITEQEAEKHPYRHVITRVLGVTSDVEVDIEEMSFSIDDTVLLCSDGLTNMLTDDEIEKILSRTPHDRACEELVKLANKHGGTDNITIAIIYGRAD